MEQIDEEYFEEMIQFIEQLIKAKAKAKKEDIDEKYIIEILDKRINLA
jgi:hypothetical protein